MNKEKKPKKLQWRHAKEERTRILRDEEIIFARRQTHGRRFSSANIKGTKPRGFDFTQLRNFKRQKRLIRKAMILARQIAQKEK